MLSAGSAAGPAHPQHSVIPHHRSRGVSRSLTHTAELLQLLQTIRTLKTHLLILSAHSESTPDYSSAWYIAVHYYKCLTDTIVIHCNN